MACMLDPFQVLLIGIDEARKESEIEGAIARRRALMRSPPANIQRIV